MVLLIEKKCSSCWDGVDDFHPKPSSFLISSTLEDDLPGCAQHVLSTGTDSVEEKFLESLNAWGLLLSSCKQLLAWFL